MHLITTILTINLLLATLCSSAQSRLVVHENKRVQLLCNQRDSLTICSFPGVKKCCGYRILVTITDDRELAYRTKAHLLSSFPDQRVDMSYQTPFFKLKIGDFLFEHEATAFNTGLSSKLNITTFITPDLIYKPDSLQKVNEQPCIEDTSLPLYTIN